jgi:hypothetical protein
VPYRANLQACSRVRKKPGNAMPANMLKKLIEEWWMLVFRSCS